ncbi:MAG: hypothetical protein IJZ79_06540 [Bacilli bacterium]|nr:hypothetical protein [Bacilli bacterium]
MKKNKFLFLIIIFILLPTRINALVGNIGIICSDANIKSGDEVTCTISGNTDEAIKLIEANITTTDNLQLVSSELSLQEGWSGSTIDNSKISVSTDSRVGNFTIGSFKIKAIDTATNGFASVGISSISFVDVSNNSNTISNTSYVITIDNNDNNLTGLSNLNVTGGTLSPFFVPNTKSYTLVIDSDNFGIEAIPANIGDQISIINTDDNTELNASNIIFSSKSGSMSIEIRVGTGDRLVTYSLIVSKKISDNDIKYLSSLTIGGKTISLVNGKYDYEVSLNDTSSFTVRAVLEDSSKYLIENLNGNIESGIYEITTNNTSLAIIIKPKDATTGLEGVIYSVTVKKINEQNTSPSNPTDSSQNNISNPQTGNISVFVITLILISSLIISLNMYKKNIENYD